MDHPIKQMEKIKYADMTITTSFVLANIIGQSSNT